MTAQSKETVPLPISILENPFPYMQLCITIDWTVPVEADMIEEMEIFTCMLRQMKVSSFKVEGGDRNFEIKVYVSSDNDRTKVCDFMAWILNRPKEIAERRNSAGTKVR